MGIRLVCLGIVWSLWSTEKVTVVVEEEEEEVEETKLNFLEGFMVVFSFSVRFCQ